MDKEALISMDPHILLSMVNLKLRDYYSSLDSYCDDIGIDKSIIEEKLKGVGYYYNVEINQFR